MEGMVLLSGGYNRQRYHTAMREENLIRSRRRFCHRSHGGRFQEEQCGLGSTNLCHLALLVQTHATVEEYSFAKKRRAGALPGNNNPPLCSAHRSERLASDKGYVGVPYVRYSLSPITVDQLSCHTFKTVIRESQIESGFC